MHDVIETGRRRLKKWGTTAAVVAVITGSGVAAYTEIPARPASAESARADACKPLPDTGNPPDLPDPTATTVATLRQAYECILDNAYAGSQVDPRVMLRDAFKAFTQELMHRNLDRPAATVSNLTGHKTEDWNAFAAAYQGVLAKLPDDAGLRQALAGATLTGMLSSLRDNHTRWDDRSQEQESGPVYSFGFLDTPSGRTTANIKDATPPLYLKEVRTDSPAGKAGLKPGDLIVAVKGLPTATDGVFNAGVLGLLEPRNDTDTVRITVRRPSTGRTWTVGLRAEARTSPTLPTVQATLLPGDIAKVTVPAMAPGFADQALAKITELRKTGRLRGVIFDVRGNGGGRAEESLKLVSSFVHGEVLSKDCDISNKCTENRTDDSVPLLNLPMTVVTNDQCVSACEDFTGSVKYSGIGKVVGTRTHGAISGKQKGFALNDNTVLVMPITRNIFAGGQMVDEIGIPADVQAQITAEDISSQRDPVIDKARELLAS